MENITYLLRSNPNPCCDKTLIPIVISVYSAEHGDEKQ